MNTLTPEVAFFVKKFRKSPEYLGTGNGKILRQTVRPDLTFSIEDIIEAKRIVRAEFMGLSEIIDIPANPTLPKILILDIETAPLMAAIWRLWKQSVNSKQIISDWFLFSWAAKWLYEEEVYSDVLTSEEAIEQDDYRIVKSLHKLMEQADVIITYNGSKFDILKINTRFLLWALDPPGLYKHIDLYKTISSQFAFSSNAMDFVNKALELTTKEDTDMNLWINCYLGDDKALKTLVHYNRNDVVMTEEQYLILRPWIKSHPNLALYGELDKQTCGVCGGTNLGHYGYTTTMVGKYEVKKCASCGSLLRDRVNVFTKEQRINIVKTQ